MHENHSQTKKAVALSVFAFSLFSISDAMRKYIAIEYEIVDILFWQAVWGILIIFLISPFVGGKSAFFNVKTIKWQLLHGFFMMMNTTLSLIAISRIPLVDAYTIFFLIPFVVSLMGVLFFKEVIGKFRLFSISCGFIGAFIAFRPGFESISPAYLYAITCVFTFSSASIIARYIGRESGALSYAFWPFLYLVAAITIYKGGKIPLDFPSYFFALAFVMGSIYGSAIIIISYAYTLAPVAVVAPYQYTQIIFALGFGYFLFGNVPDFFKIIGASIIVGAGIMLYARERINEKRNSKIIEPL